MARAFCFLVLLTLIGCREGEDEESAVAGSPEDSVEQSESSSFLGLTSDQMDSMIKPGMSAEQVYSFFGEPDSKDVFLDEDCESYFFVTDPSLVPASGTLIGVSVFYQKGVVTRWTGEYQGGAYRTDEDGNSTKIN